MTTRHLVLGSVAALGLLACGGGSSVAGLHQSCPESGCARGQTCLSYCGIGCAPDGGASVQTCEIVCADASDCPSGMTCAFLSDGPPGKTCQ